jgi:hypothetical protein
MLAVERIAAWALALTGALFWGMVVYLVRDLGLVQAHDAGQAQAHARKLKVTTVAVVAAAASYSVELEVAFDFQE